jgi:hypothetical protein
MFSSVFLLETIRGHHIVSLAKLWAWLALIIIPLFAITTKTLSSVKASVALPSVHKKELFASTLEFFHKAVE